MSDARKQEAIRRMMAEAAMHDVPILGQTPGVPPGTQHKQVPIRRVTLNATGPDGKTEQVELIGTPKTIEVIEEMMQQIQKLQLMLDARGRQESEPREEWTPFERAHKITSPMDLYGEMRECEMWVNNHYTVGVYRQDGIPLDEGGNGRMVHLSIRRNDRTHEHDWRDYQRIKNDLVGEEVEAVELYPAESRLVDGANQYHLFCFPDAQFPFGFSERLVSESTDGGVTQRAWRDSERPADLKVVTRDDMQRALQTMIARGEACANQSSRAAGAPNSSEDPTTGGNSS